MISLEDALAAYAQHLQALPAETVQLALGLNRVLAQAHTAETDLPRFDQSAMDGYALRAADVAAASPAQPLRLPIGLHIAAGLHEPLPGLPAQAAARIFTGAVLPAEADTVIAQERVTLDGDALVFEQAYPAQRNIRRRGEELRRGSTVAAAGQRLGPGLLASLVNAGLQQLRVTQRPRIRVLISGDEIRPAGATLKNGEIHDSNGLLIGAMLQHWGYPPPLIEHVRDDAGLVKRALQRAFGEAELVLSAGGASVGDHDFLPAAAESLGLRRVFWKVAQKPAKPLFFGVRGKQAYLALPGNPGAVLIGLILHVRSTLDCLEGAAEPGPAWHCARLAQAVEHDPQRVRLLRMRLDYADDGVALLQPLPKQDSHMLSNLSSAQVLAWVPIGDGVCASGTVLRWTALPA